MLFKYDSNTGKAEPVQIHQMHSSAFGAVKVYKIGADLYFESGDWFGALAEKIQKTIIPGILKVMGLKVDTPDEKKRSK